MKANSKYILLFAALTVLILWQMLLPGYILTLDLVFTPHFAIPTVSANNFNNSLPLYALLHVLNFLMVGWLLEKIVLVAIIFLAGYLFFRFAPLQGLQSLAAERAWQYPETLARVFGAVLFMANPFVYSRLLAGHWAHLLAYSLLPLLFYLVFAIKNQPSAKAAIKLAATLALIAIFSVHFFVMAALLTATSSIATLVYGALRRNGSTLRFAKYILLAGISLIIASSYWLVPAFKRSAPVEQNFSYEHWQAFAASGHQTSAWHKPVPVLLNLATLNGFWGEREPWHLYFNWPQEHWPFWIAAALVLLLTLYGAYKAIKNPQTRSAGILITMSALLALIFATGISETPFRSLNLWLYQHIPFWDGFRDSQKFIGVVAFGYAALASHGLACILSWISKLSWISNSTQNSRTKVGQPTETWQSIQSILPYSAFLIPIFFAPSIWLGLHGQLKPVFYPQSWYDSEKITAAAPNAGILVLPWHGYLSFQFAGNRILSNPAPNFFWRNNVFVSKSLELQNIYDQEPNKAYLQLDNAIRNNSILLAPQTTDKFKESGIQYIVYFQDLGSDIFHYNFLLSPHLTLVIDRPDLKMYKINN